MWYDGAVIAVIVAGVAWYRDRRGEDVLLPADCVVSYASLLASPSKGRIAVWTLPGGGFAVDRRHLPLEPVPIDQVFPLGAADIPWSAGGDLTRAWQPLFRVRDAFEPWGDERDDALGRLYQRRRPPRTTFRAGPGRRELRLLYPQIVPASLCYRLGDGYFKLAEPLRQACRPLIAEGTQVRLVAGEQTQRLRADATPDELRQLATALEHQEADWRLLPPEAHSPLLIVPH